MRYIEPLSNLIAQLTKLPGVGEKTAARYAYSLLNASKEDTDALIAAIKEVKDKVHFCSVCGNYTDNDVCDICKERSPKVICVVKEPKDIAAFERLKDFKSKMILQVHDELIVDAAKEEADEVIKILVEEMSNAAKLKVPLVVNYTVAENWGLLK